MGLAVQGEAQGPVTTPSAEAAHLASTAEAGSAELEVPSPALLSSRIAARQTLIEPALSAPLSGPLPPGVAAALAPVDTLSAAQAATRKLAHDHYENFSVVSMLLPKRLRQDFCNVYAFCRVADDLGDELGDPHRSFACLQELRSQTYACFAGERRSAVFIALADTVARHDLPIKPFLDLISAFEQDQRNFRYETFEQLADYCTRSADPVGRLVLYLCGYRDEVRQRLSDQTCTALQLANFWQGVRGDWLERRRIYLPQDSMDRFGVSPQQVKEARFDSRFRELVRFEVHRAWAMFDEGDQLLPTLDRSVRLQISLFGRGGRAILKAIRRQNYDTLSRQPKLSRWRKTRLACGVLFDATLQTMHNTLVGSSRPSHRAKPSEAAG